MLYQIICYATDNETIAFEYLSSSPAAGYLLANTTLGYYKDGVRYISVDDAESLFSEIDAAEFNLLPMA